MPTKRPPAVSADPTAPETPPGPAGKARLTLGDLAQLLGVSRATVSNAFNRPDQLSAVLRNEILTKSRELGYFGPDPAARALRRPELREVAVVYHHGLQYALSDPLSIEFLKGVGSELDQRGLSLQLIPKLGRKLALSAAFQTTADALIVHAEIGPELAPEVLGARKPLVLVDTLVIGVPSIGIDDRSGAAQAMAHVLSRQPDQVLVLGFTLNKRQRALVFGGGSSPPPNPSLAVERYAGYVAAITQAGWPADRIDWLAIDDQNPENSAEQLSQVQRRLAPGTRLGVVAMTDRMALSALRQIRDWAGIELVGAVGFDDIPAAAAAGLSTIRQDAFKKGQLAVQAVLDGVRPALLPVELVVRQT
jgi:DNA-binding LacI/PurR family transcriptional regulator